MPLGLQRWNRHSPLLNKYGWKQWKKGCDQSNQERQTYFCKSHTSEMEFGLVNVVGGTAMKDAPFHWVASGPALFRFSSTVVFHVLKPGFRFLHSHPLYSSYHNCSLRGMVTFRLLNLAVIDHSSSFWSFNKFCLNTFFLLHLILLVSSSSLRIWILFFPPQNIIYVLTYPKFIPVFCIPILNYRFAF